MNNLHDFHYSFILANQLYGIELSETEEEEIALIAWNFIGNKRTRLYRCTLDVNCDGIAELPCNVDIIEAVTHFGEDYQYTTNITEFDNYDSRFIENYIESRRGNRNPLYQSGGFVKYTRVGNTLQIDSGTRKVRVLYRGVELDEDGLPLLTEAEALAIATYIAYIYQQKKGLVTQNQGLLLIALLLKAEWEKRCDHARVADDYWSQNDMDQILDVKHSWNRKMYGKSYKPIR